MKRMLSDYPNLINEWDYENNKGLNPLDFSTSSHQSVSWKCKLGHTWQATIKNRTKGTGCPTCSGKIILTGFNDFGSNYPELLKEWAFDLNKDDPFKTARYSSREFFWRCEKGHVWKDSLNHRTSRNSKCPYCQNKRVLKGFNDFESLFPMLATEWDNQKNTIKPCEVTRGSNRKVWWKCPNGHDSYRASVYDRCRGAGCTICNTMFQTSFPEQAVLFYVKQVFPDAISRYRDIFKGKMELDIFIPSRKVGIEYDGSVWHNIANSEKRESKKYSICRDNGIFLYRIREESDNKENADKVFKVPAFSYDKSLELDKVIVSLIKEIADGSTVDVNIERDIFEILKYKTIKYEESLAFLYPDVCKEWHPVLNKGLKPENVLPGTTLKVWWKCQKCGNEWKALIRNRINGHGCNICATEQRKETYHKVRLNTRDLLIDCKCVIDWDYSKNEHTPGYYTKSSGEEVWWKCHKCGYEWKTAIFNRTRNNRKNACPACTKRILVRGVNDLKTTNPELLDEWDYSLNLDVDPSSITQWSRKHVWWKCKKCGYQYKATPGNRVFGKGCGCCAGRVVVPGINDLATTMPELALDWHPTKNGSLKPTDVTKGRRDMIWWKCHVCGNEWQDSLNHRSRGRGCSVCHKNAKKALKYKK